MKRNFLKLLAVCLSVFLVSPTIVGFAAEQGEVNSFDITFSETKTGEITLSGNFSEADKNRMVSLFLLSADKATGEVGKISTETVEHIGQTRVSNSGAWSYTFVFKGDSGTYRFSVACDKIKLVTDRAILNEEDLNGFISDLTNNKLGFAEITAFLSEFGECFAIDMSMYDSQERLALLVNDIVNGIDVIAAKGRSGINEIEKVTYKKAEILKVIETTGFVNNIYHVLTQNNEVIGIDFTDYNNLSGEKKHKVLSQMQGNVYAGMSEVKEAFESLAETEKNISSSSGGNSSGGGSAGGGFGGGGGMIYADEVQTEATEEEPPQNQALFTDIENVKWAEQAIAYLAENHVISGYEDGSFKPDNKVTREEFVKMVVMAFGLLKDDAKVHFKDVQETQWFYPYIASAYEQGIISGISEDEFGTGENIIRQDIAVILYHIIGAEKLSGMKQREQVFIDKEEMSDYATDAVTALSEAGIINGMEDGRFAPKNSATRAESAKLIYEALIRSNQ